MRCRRLSAVVGGVGVGGWNTVGVIAALVRTSKDRVSGCGPHFFDRWGWSSWTPSWRVSVPVRSRVPTWRSSSRRPRAPEVPGSLVHPLVDPQAGRVPGGTPRTRWRSGGSGCKLERTTFQRTKTSKDSYDPLREEKPDRIEEALDKESGLLLRIR